MSSGRNPSASRDLAHETIDVAHQRGEGRRIAALAGRAAVAARVPGIEGEVVETASRRPDAPCGRHARGRDGAARSRPCAGMPGRRPVAVEESRCRRATGKCARALCVPGARPACLGLCSSRDPPHLTLSARPSYWVGDRPRFLLNIVHGDGISSVNGVQQKMNVVHDRMWKPWLPKAKRGGVPSKRG